MLWYAWREQGFPTWTEHDLWPLTSLAAAHNWMMWNFMVLKTKATLFCFFLVHPEVQWVELHNERESSLVPKSHPIHSHLGFELLCMASWSTLCFTFKSQLFLSPLFFMFWYRLLNPICRTCLNLNQAFRSQSSLPNFYGYLSTHSKLRHDIHGPKLSMVRKTSDHKPALTSMVLLTMDIKSGPFILAWPPFCTVIESLTFMVVLEQHY